MKKALAPLFAIAISLIVHLHGAPRVEAACLVSASPPTYANGTFLSSDLCDTSGNIRVTGSGGESLAQGSDTSGATGGLTLCASTTSAPTYTSGQNNPCSVTTGGALRVYLDGTAVGVSDPCNGTKTHISINISTATTTELTPSLSGTNTYWYVCSIDLITAAANNVALVDDDTDGCLSVTAGLAGGTTAAAGWNFKANGGIVKGNGTAWVFKSPTANSVLCLITSAATQLSGSIQVVAAQ